MFFSWQLWWLFCRVAFLSIRQLPRGTTWPTRCPLYHPSKSPWLRHPAIVHRHATSVRGVEVLAVPAETVVIALRRKRKSKSIAGTFPAKRCVYRPCVCLAVVVVAGCPSGAAPVRNVGFDAYPCWKNTTTSAKSASAAGKFGVCQ